MVSSGVTGIELAQLPPLAKPLPGKRGGAALCIQPRSALGQVTHVRPPPKPRAWEGGHLPP